MRKFIYSLFAVLALSCTFVSCSDDDGDAPAPAGNPAEAAAGTYTGTWTIVVDGDTATAPGTVTLAPGDTTFVAKLTLASDEYKIKVGSSNSTRKLKAEEVTNIAFAGNSKSFSLSNAAGKIGNFAGKITDGAVKFYYSSTEKVGRKAYNFNYRFESNN